MSTPPLYLYNPTSHEWTYLFWGWGSLVSPDRTKVLVKRVHDREFFSYYLWNATTDVFTSLFMIQEKHVEYEDTKWTIQWSDDSQAIQFIGKTQQLGTFNFIYHIPSGKNYNL